MTTRTDFSVAWDVSPRIITVAAPSVEATIQDIVDTLRVIEESVRGVSEPKLLNAAGKEPLGGGVLVGITASLQDALIEFEARAGPTFTQCRISGGNLVAFDDVGAVQNSPVNVTAYTQVVLTASSSATLQEQDEIQQASFEGGVTIDVVNGESGTAYPIGTPTHPVKDLASAKTIAVTRGLRKLFVIGDLTLGASDDITDYELIGQGSTLNSVSSRLALVAGSSVADAIIRDVRVDGTQAGEARFFDSIIEEILDCHCTFTRCALIGPLVLNNAGFFDTHYKIFHNCYSGVDGFTLNYDGSGMRTIFTNYTGYITVTNLTNAVAVVEINLDAGVVTLDASCTAGVVRIRGTGQLINNSVGTTVDATGLVQNSVWGHIKALTVEKFFGLK